jgi:hypothetical protein
MWDARAEPMLKKQTSPPEHRDCAMCFGRTQRDAATKAAGLAARAGQFPGLFRVSITTIHFRDGRGFPAPLKTGS